MMMRKRKRDEDILIKSGIDEVSKMRIFLVSSMHSWLVSE